MQYQMQYRSGFERTQAIDVAIWCALGYSRVARRTTPIHSTRLYSLERRAAPTRFHRSGGRSRHRACRCLRSLHRGALASPTSMALVCLAEEPSTASRTDAVSRFLDAATASVYGAVLRPNPASREIATAWARLTAPSLLMMIETWLRTVFSEIFSRTDISILLDPWATSSRTSRSRAVNSSIAFTNCSQAGSVFSRM